MGTNNLNENGPNRYVFWGTKNMVGVNLMSTVSKKNLHASRPSEHPPVWGGNVKTFRWDHRLQYKTSSWHLNGFPDGSNIIGSTV